MVKLLIGALLALTASNAIAGNVFIYEDEGQQALTASNAIAGNVFIYEDEGQQALLSNTKPSGHSEQFTKKVKTTYYRAEDNADSDTTKRSSSRRYASSAYAALR